MQPISNNLINDLVFEYKTRTFFFEFLNEFWWKLKKNPGKVKITRHLSVIQMIHDWQNTGSQNHQLFTSRRITNEYSSSEDDESSTKFLCPMCCSCTEWPSHFLFFLCDKLQQYQINLGKSLCDKLMKKHTYDGIISLLLHVLKHVHANNFSYHELHPNMSQHLNTAISLQSTLGWHHFLHGIWHNNWFTLQQLHTTYIKQHNGIKQWSKIILHEVLIYG